jgi:hypothetical protein
MIRWRRQRGQSMTELALLMPVLSLFFIGFSVVLVLLYQGWALGRALDDTAVKVAGGVMFDEIQQQDLIDRAAALGVELDPARDTLVISVTKAEGNGDCGTPTCTYGWDDEVSVEYGDMLRFELTIEISIGVLTGYIESIFPDGLSAGAGWSGIAQRNTPDDGDVIEPPETTGRLIGTVFDDGGAPLAGATVELDTDPVTSVVSDANGQYEIDDVEPGSYTGTASKAAYLDDAAPVSISAGMTTSHDFTLTSVIVITVNVTDALNDPVIGAEVTTDLGHSAVDNGDGSYTLSVPIGTYVILAEDPATAATGSEPSTYYDQNTIVDITIN